VSDPGAAPPPPEDPDAPPPVLGSWRNAYALVIGELLVLIALFALWTRWAS
jgi:hypothetical protein